MKLLFAIKSLNVVGGGAERVLVDVANGMAARGHEVHVLTFDSPGESFYPLSPLVTRIDIAIGQPGKPTSRTAFARSIRRIRRSVQALGADLVIPFMHSTYVPLVLALLGTGTRIIVSEHVDNTHYLSRPVSACWFDSSITWYWQRLFPPCHCAMTIQQACDLAYMSCEMQWI